MLPGLFASRPSRGRFLAVIVAAVVAAWWWRWLPLAPPPALPSVAGPELPAPLVLVWFPLLTTSLLWPPGSR